jgi:hypothetical protein
VVIVPPIRQDRGSEIVACSGEVLGGVESLRVGVIPGRVEVTGIGVHFFRARCIALQQVADDFLVDPGLLEKEHFFRAQFEPDFARVEKHQDRFVGDAAFGEENHVFERGGPMLSLTGDREHQCREAGKDDRDDSLLLHVASPGRPYSARRS